MHLSVTTRGLDFCLSRNLAEHSPLPINKCDGSVGGPATFDDFNQTNVFGWTVLSWNEILIREIKCDTYHLFSVE